MIMESLTVEASVVPTAAGQTAECPGLDSVVDRNWIWKCTSWNWGQDHM